jgi:hypothetical protein
MQVPAIGLYMLRRYQNTQNQHGYVPLAALVVVVVVGSQPATKKAVLQLPQQAACHTAAQA